MTAHNNETSARQESVEVPPAHKLSRDDSTDSHTAAELNSSEILKKDALSGDTGAARTNSESISKLCHSEQYHSKQNHHRAGAAASIEDLLESQTATGRSVSSRLPGFYELPLSERLQLAKAFADLSPADTKALGNFSTLSGELVDVFIENAVGTFALPLGIATNFLIDGRDILVPMAVEESSVLAAASHGAKLARAGGGFQTSSTASVMTGQIQLFMAGIEVDWRERLESRRGDLLAFANQGHDRLLARGGGACDLTWRYIDEIDSLVIHLHCNTVDAMGANIINTMCEKLSCVMPDLLDLDCPAIEHFEPALAPEAAKTSKSGSSSVSNADRPQATPPDAITKGSSANDRLELNFNSLETAADYRKHGRIGLRILTNYTDRRLSKATCRVPRSALTTKEIDGAELAKRIVKAYQFAWYDVYRATTNNKGVMNGIDPVLIATGNDWRAVEAGAHAWTCRDGRYRPMAKWSLDSGTGDLLGELELPMAVGTVGGVTKLHPTSRAALNLMGSPDARQLGEITCAVGLAQNLSALRALASEGIQRGHMSLHKRNLDLLRHDPSKSSHH